MPRRAATDRNRVGTVLTDRLLGCPPHRHRRPARTGRRAGSGRPRRLGPDRHQPGHRACRGVTPGPSSPPIGVRNARSTPEAESER